MWCISSKFILFQEFFNILIGQLDNTLKKIALYITFRASSLPLHFTSPFYGALRSFKIQTDVTVSAAALPFKGKVNERRTYKLASAFPL